MSKQTTLEEIELLSMQLPLKEQLKLLSRLSHHLTEVISRLEVNSKTQRQKNAVAILRECDRAAAAFTRKTDSSETIRHLREERHQQLCQSES
jgi:hypothetical protein